MLPSRGPGLAIADSVGDALVASLQAVATKSQLKMLRAELETVLAETVADESHGSAAGTSSQEASLQSSAGSGRPGLANAAAQYAAAAKGATTTVAQLHSTASAPATERSSPTTPRTPRSRLAAVPVDLDWLMGTALTHWYAAHGGRTWGAENEPKEK